MLSFTVWGIIFLSPSSEQRKAIHDSASNALPTTWLLAHDLLYDVFDVFVPNWNINYNLSIATDCSDNTKPKLTAPNERYACGRHLAVLPINLSDHLCFEY